MNQERVFVVQVFGMAVIAFVLAAVIVTIIGELLTPVQKRAYALMFRRGALCSADGWAPPL